MVQSSAFWWKLCTARLLPVACAFSILSLQLDAEPDVATLF